MTDYYIQPDALALTQLHQSVVTKALVTSFNVTEKLSCHFTSPDMIGWVIEVLDKRGENRIECPVRRRRMLWPNITLRSDLRDAIHHFYLSAHGVAYITYFQTYDVIDDHFYTPAHGVTH